MGASELRAPCPGDSGVEGEPLSPPPIPLPPPTAPRGFTKGVRPLREHRACAYNFLVCPPPAEAGGGGLALGRRIELFGPAAPYPTLDKLAPPLTGLGRDAQ